LPKKTLSRTGRAWLDFGQGPVGSGALTTWGITRAWLARGCWRIFDATGTGPAKIKVRPTFHAKAGMDTGRSGGARCRAMGAGGRHHHSARGRAETLAPQFRGPPCRAKNLSTPQCLFACIGFNKGPLGYRNLRLGGPSRHPDKQALSACAFFWRQGKGPLSCCRRRGPPPTTPKFQVSRNGPGKSPRHFWRNPGHNPSKGRGQDQVLRHNPRLCQRL